jgi:hypothetical protein
MTAPDPADLAAELRSLLHRAGASAEIAPSTPLTPYARAWLYDALTGGERPSLFFRPG